MGIVKAETGPLGEQLAAMQQVRYAPPCPDEIVEKVTIRTKRVLSKQGRDR